MDLWQYLHAATFNIVDPDDSLADAVIDHHEVDPFIPCPNDATHELLRNTLIYNGTVVPAHGFLGERSREGKLPAFSYQGMRVAGPTTTKGDLNMEMKENLRAALFGTLIVGVMLGCEETTAPTTPPAIESTPRFTMGSGTTSTLVGRGSFVPGFKVKRESNGWEAEVEVKPDLDVAVQTITFAPGGQSGWHRHPGPVFITVKTGTMTFYESDDPTCTPIIRSGGQGFLDTGEHAHIARNESAAPAENVVVYFAPVGAALRIDAPDPGNCSF